MTLFSDFTSEETSLYNISRLKLQYKNLSHVKTGTDFKGVLLTKNGKFVAVLQCNVRTGYIVALEVAPDYRKQGIAKKLLDYAGETLGCKKLTTNINNTAAESLYKQYGYQIKQTVNKTLFMERK